MGFPAIDLSAFSPERERGLKALYRYSRFEVMLYRSNLWMHTQRMCWMIEELSPILLRYFPRLDVNKCRVLALVHDDAELITGDIQAGHKALMKKSQLDQLDKDEAKAARSLAKISPRSINGYSYEKLLLEAIDKNTLEAQVVNYFDKLDAYNESLHELWAGNISFIRSVLFYSRAIPTFRYKYPRLAKFFEDKSSALTFIDDRLNTPTIYAKSYASIGRHTAKSLLKKTEFPVYDAWKKIVLKRGKKEAENWLIKPYKGKMVA